jgi:hypothetical protein
MPSWNLSEAGFRMLGQALDSYLFGPNLPVVAAPPMGKFPLGSLSARPSCTFHRTAQETDRKK